MIDLGTEDNNIKMDDKRLTGKYVQNIILQQGPVAGCNEYGNRPAIKKAGNILSVRRILKGLFKRLRPARLYYNHVSGVETGGSMM